ncbi:hypothetical protein [Pontibacter arcticus]|uniref:Uncharacterized protein n=1 Tax=Pontibacter arcticus TaxID=2080288 RepID=A0A364REL6_9BACT|nr:hypothetical protein [Pontibacter arcticus]RAU82733.1 hypothetical protein DP923_05610 [Pontibacter arcticus]
MSLKKYKSHTSYLLLGMLLLSGCFEKKSANQETEPAATTEQTPQPEPIAPAADESMETPVSAPDKVDVQVYLEISNGMKGFMPQAAADKEPTGFQSKLNKLISEVQDGRYVVSKSYYLAKQDAKGNPVLDSVSYQTMKGTIVGGIKSDVLGTPLPAMLEVALKNAVSQNAVSIIVSDFIHGPDPRKPEQFISLDSDIRSSLKLAEQKGLAIAVLADASEFYGSYHPAVKKPEIKRTLNGELIPYYIWVIGKQQEVQVVTSKVLRQLPAQQAYFGFSYTSVPFSALLKSKTFKPNGNVYCASRTAEVCKSINLLPEKNVPVEFTIGLNLNNLPLSMQQSTYLKSNLKLKNNGIKASILSVQAADENTKATPELAKYSHFVNLQVPQLTASSGAISLHLPQQTPNWIAAWSTTNDNNPAAAPKKTYQLTKIIEGVYALYRDRSEDVFQATIQFNKAD